MAYPHDALLRESRKLVKGGLPLISQGLDSVRAYGFECRFVIPTTTGLSNSENLTLAAKQVTVPGLVVSEIVVNRLNDAVYYPGKVQKEDLKVTFDDLYDPRVATQLFTWFKSIYDPITGIMAGQTFRGKQFKGSLKVISLDGEGVPKATTSYFGVWPKNWKGSDFNYGSNEFHNIEVSFSYDFMEHADGLQ